MLRVGFILEDDEVPFWVNEIIKRAGLDLSIQLVKVSLPNVQKDDRSIPYKLFSSLDHTIFPGNPSALSKIKVEFPEGTSTLHLNLTENSLDQQGLDKVKESNLDLIIHFGQTSLHKSILSIPRLGTWFIQFSNTKLPHCYAGFWEWFYKEQVNSVSILQIKERDGLRESTLAKADAKIDHLSLSRNQTLIFSKAIDLVINSLNRVSSDRDFNSPKNDSEVPQRKRPGFWHVSVAFFKLLLRLAQKSLSKIFYIEQWVLFSSQNQNFPTFDFKGFKPITPPKDRFWADPFVVSQDDKHFVFIEEFPYKTKKGHLNCIVLDAQGKMEDSQVILEKPYHLSYPFIFAYKDKWFMIPESAENKTVDLYECIEFPFKWTFRRTLLEGFHAYDSTLHVVNDRIWLFCTIQQSKGGSPNDDLYLFFTDNLLEGKWTPHTQNPVVSDPYNARPAGKIFKYEGEWYRPSQVCVPRYGYALAINRIDQLDEKSYRETRITQNLPDWHQHLVSTHTYNSSAQLTITDGQLKRFRF